VWWVLGHSLSLQRVYPYTQFNKIGHFRAVFSVQPSTPLKYVYLNIRNSVSFLRLLESRFFLLCYKQDISLRDTDQATV
jgi:hypothetical protein